MKILAIRTDRPTAEVYVYEDHRKLAALKWQAHLKLAESLNSQITKILNKSSISYKELDGIVIYKGPGSFTGLRIGISAANALAYAQSIPVVAKGGNQWLEAGIEALRSGHNDKLAIPEYGAPVRVSQPRK